MITNSIFAATVVLLAILIFFLQECTFLIPFRQLIWTKYTGTIVTFAAILLLNLFALFYLLIRKLSLNDTGQKLAHLEKELRSGGAISEELAQRLED